VQAIFAAEDARFSRFRADSELALVNARAGRWTTVSRPFAELLGFALDSAAQTGGLFDPTILPALLTAGYDRDFREVAERPRVAPILPPPEPGGRWTEVELMPGAVRLPRGVALDFGGVAKGWTVDRAAEAAEAAVAELPWAVVDAGGDLRVVGRLSGEPLDIAIEDPFERGREMLRVGLEDGALATSAVTARSWGPGLHQLIDPRTSRPSVTGVVQATVWASTCAEAEVTATWAVLHGPGVLHEVPCALVLDVGEVWVSLATRLELMA
jgi:thiamine biosynthesis lipoprotein